MPDIQNLVFFGIATLTLNISPGPDMLYVIARTIEQGRKSGIMSALGIVTGCFIHIFATALGLSVILLKFPWVFDVIKYGGAGYLTYMGIRILVTRSTTANDSLRKEYKRPFDLFRQGVITNVLNPKVALFILTFLPQFVDPQKGHVALQILFLGGLFILSGFTVLCVVVLLVHNAGELIKTKLGTSSVLRIISGGILIALGVRLAFFRMSS